MGSSADFGPDPFFSIKTLESLHHRDPRAGHMMGYWKGGHMDTQDQ